MIILAIDTSGRAASACVRTPTGAGVAASEEARAHGRVLPALMRQAASSAGVELADITHVAAARGPGLFTGMRVGIVTAEIFALARGIPAAGVSTLHALASRVVAAERPDRPFAVLLDARRREVFAQTFEPSGAPLDEPRALALAGIRGPGGISADVADDGFFIDQAAVPYGLPGHPVRTDGLAAEVAGIARSRWRSGSVAEPLAPLYLRRPDTTAAKPARSVLGSP